jgi:hypothetical protein
VGSERGCENLARQEACPWLYAWWRNVFWGENLGLGLESKALPEVSRHAATLTGVGGEDLSRGRRRKLLFILMLR